MPSELETLYPDENSSNVTPIAEPTEPKIIRIEPVVHALETSEPQPHIAIVSPDEPSMAMNVPRTQVIEDGKEVVRPDVVSAVVQLGILGQLAKIRKSMEREQYQGKVDPRELDANDELQYIDLLENWPHVAWASATLKNRGDDTVYVSINRSLTYFPLQIGDQVSLDFTKGDERINYIQYYCDSGETATLSAIGKY